MKKIKKIIIEIINFLDQNLSIIEEKKIADLIRETQLDQIVRNQKKPKKIHFQKSFQNALLSIRLKNLIPVKEAIDDASNDLIWTVDNGDFYNQNMGIGTGYLNGNMNTELIGPKKGIFKSKELRLGLFFLERNILYKDHQHAAPELYLNLTEGTKWRFDNMDWEEKPSGSIVYNQPFKTHAMKVGRVPFLSIWCWPYNSNEKCILVKK